MAEQAQKKQHIYWVSQAGVFLAIGHNGLS